jgi:hypothetical protein
MWHGQRKFISYVATEEFTLKFKLHGFLFLLPSFLPSLDLCFHRKLVAAAITAPPPLLPLASVGHRLGWAQAPQPLVPYAASAPGPWFEVPSDRRRHGPRPPTTRPAGGHHLMATNRLRPWPTGWRRPTLQEI